MLRLSAMHVKAFAVMAWDRQTKAQRYIIKTNMINDLPARDAWPKVLMPSPKAIIKKKKEIRVVAEW